MFQSISFTDGHCYWVVASTGPILSFININRYKNRYLIRVWCIQKRRPKRSQSCKGDFMVFSLVALQCIGCDNDCYLDDFSETEDFSRQNPPLRLTSLLERAHKNWWPSNIRTMIIIIMGVEIMALVSHDDDKLTLSFFNWQTLAFCAVFLDLIADTHTSTQFCPLHQIMGQWPIKLVKGWLKYSLLPPQTNSGLRGAQSVTAFNPPLHLTFELFCRCQLQGRVSWAWGN